MRLLVLLYSLTGATSLAYQLAWSRLMAREFGATLLATSAVVAWYLIGLAFGSLLFGRRADRSPNPLRLYGWLELGVASYAVLSPMLAQLWISAAEGRGTPGILVASGFFLLPPTILMGGSFPAMLAAASIDNRTDTTDRTSRPALLYGANTSGAVAGVLFTAFVALRSFGLSRTITLAATLNLAVALSALWLARRRLHFRHDDSQRRESPTATTSDRPYARESSSPPSSATTTALIVLCLSGFASLLAEIAWTRALSLVLGSSVYAFAIVLAAFLLGIGLGALMYARRGAGKDPLRDLAHFQFRAALASGLFAVLLTIAPGVLIQILRAGHSSPLGMAIGAFSVAFLATAYATTAFGAAFPAGISVLLATSSPGRACGVAFALNTIGAVCGALLTSTLLIPNLGLARTLALGVATSLLAGSIAVGPRGSVRAAAILAAVATLVLLPAWWRWNQELLISGVYAYAYRYAGDQTDGARHQTATSKLTSPPQPSRPKVEPQLMYAADGAHANVAVYRDENGELSLLLDGKADASTALDGDMRTQLLLGHLPAIFRSERGLALVIGLGSGVTLSALLQHPFEQVDVVELESRVAEVAGTWFSAANRSALADSRVRLAIDDGRRWVRNARNHYDIITSEPSNLWMSGVSNLFTAEFFAQARSALVPGGVLCQWMHLYQVSTEDVRIVLRGLRLSFPHAALFLDGPDLLIIASDAPLDLMNFEPVVAADLARVGVYSADELSVLYVGDERAIDRFTGPGRLHTDDRPLLEFSAPLSIARDDSFHIARQLEEVAQ